MQIPAAGVRKAVPLKLPPDVALDLHAFCEAHYGAKQNEVICRALRRFIDSELEADSPTKTRFLEARERIQGERRLTSVSGPTETFRLVPGLSNKTADDPTRR